MWYAPDWRGSVACLAEAPWIATGGRGVAHGHGRYQSHGEVVPGGLISPGAAWSRNSIVALGYFTYHYVAILRSLSSHSMGEWVSNGIIIILDALLDIIGWHRQPINSCREMPVGLLVTVGTSQYCCGCTQNKDYQCLCVS